MNRTEDQIERMVERKFDALDRRFMKGEISQAEYNERSADIADWAAKELRFITR